MAATKNQRSAVPKASDGRTILRGGPAITRYLGSSTRQVQRMLQRGEFPGHRLGKLWCDSPETLDGYLEELGGEALCRTFEGRLHD